MGSVRKKSEGSRSVSLLYTFFFFSSRRRHTRSDRDWSSDVCSSDLELFKKDTIVVDFGTATTFDCITADEGGAGGAGGARGAKGRFIGGVIMPGLRTDRKSVV